MSSVTTQNILVVADGVGGAVGGKLASSIAVRSVVEYLAEAVGCVQDFDVDREQTFLDHLSRTVERGHDRLKEMFQTQGGPATTLTMVTIVWRSSSPCILRRITTWISRPATAAARNPAAIARIHQPVCSATM